LLLARAAVRTSPSLASTTYRGLASMNIEVEKKFEPPTDLAELGRRIAELGGIRLGEKTFTDVYYDTPSCSLTRRDTWLRCRDGNWELKLPVEADAKRSGGERTVFEEIEGAAPVNDVLQQLLQVRGCSSLEETLCASKAHPFAEFATARSKWALGGCTIDADVASFGHAVMEIEVLVEAASEVARAEAEIGRVAELVGAQPLSALGGKLETYIRRHSPVVLAALVEEGILEDREDVVDKALDKTLVGSEVGDAAASAGVAAPLARARTAKMCSGGDSSTRRVGGRRSPLGQPPVREMARRGVCGMAAALASIAVSSRTAAITTGAVERDMSKSTSRETILGYKDDLGVKSYSAVQRAWESSSGKSSTEIMMAARGAGKRDADAPPESERSRKRRGMAGCHEEVFRKRAASESEVLTEAACNSRVLGGDVQFMLDVLDVD